MDDDKRQQIKDATKLIEAAKILADHGYSHTASVVVDIAQEIVEACTNESDIATIPVSSIVPGPEST